jgi:hypothetical protein
LRSPAPLCGRAGTTIDPVPCGDVTLYCPSVSLAPLTVTAGYYTAPAPGVLTNATNTMAQRLECPAGSYCTGGVQLPCPAGTFQSGLRKTSAADCRTCIAGYYCPPATSTPVPCGNDTRYCPEGSPQPLLAGPGQFTDGVPGSRSSSFPCQAGSYCLGDGHAISCPAGTYGAVQGLTNATCSGRCMDGVLCESQSVDITGVPCPEGSYCLQVPYLPIPCHAIVCSALVHWVCVPPCWPPNYRSNHCVSPFSPRINHCVPRRACP